MPSTANSRSKPTTWGYRDKLKGSQLETIESNAAGAISRANSNSGTRNIALRYMGSESTDYIGVYYTASGAMMTEATAAADRQHIVFSLSDLPQRHTLNSVRVYFDTDAGHTGQPTSLPQIKVQAVDTGGSITNLGTATYSWVSTAAFNAGFALTATCGTSGHTIDHSVYRYQLMLFPEWGNNSLDCEIESCKVSVTLDTASAGTDFSFWV